MSRILVVGLNPAWQKISFIPSFKVGQVNRLQSQWECASGKGINTARVLKKLGHDVSVLQIVGGTAGEKILFDLKNEAIPSIHATVGTETRTCTTLLSLVPQSVTELIEPFAVDPKIQSTLLDQLKNQQKQASLGFEGLVFCGSLPQGFPLDTFALIHQIVNPHYSVLDGVRGFDPHFLNRVQGIKVNESEFELLKPQILDACHSEVKILVTQNYKDAELYHFSPPQKFSLKARFVIPSITPINTTGAGDAVTAAFSEYWPLKKDLVGSCKHALAIGTASCLTRFPSEYQESDRKRILAQL